MASGPWEDFDWESIRETPEQRQERARISADVSSDPRNFHAEERQLVQAQPAGITPVSAPQPPVAGPWMDFQEQPQAVDGPWAEFESVPGKASWWETIAAIPGSTVGRLKRAAGGALQAISETDWQAGAEMERLAAPAMRPLEESAHIKFIAKKEGRSVQDVAEEWKEAQTNSPVAQAGRDVFQAGTEQVEANTPENLSFWQQATLSGASSVLAQVPSLAVGIATRSLVIPLAAAGAAAGGESYGEARDKHLEPERALSHAGIDASIEVAMEYLPFKFLTDKAGGPVLELIVGTLIREVPTEAATTVLQSANAKLSTRPEMTWEEFAQDVIDTAGATLIAAPLLGGAARVMAPLDRTGRATEPAPAPAAEPAPIATAENWAETAQFGNASAGLKGAENPDLLPPSIDEPTVTLPSEAEEQLKMDFNALEPDSITPEQRSQGRRLVEDFQKAQKAPALPGAEAAWSQVATAPSSALEDIGELGASNRQTSNAAAYINPNQGERLDRVFTFGPEGFVGLTPRQALPKPGTYTLGVPSDDRPADYLRAVHDTVEEWRSKYLPGDTVVLSNEQLFSNSALGWHYHTDRNSHMIVPAVLRKPSRGLGAYNPNTQATAFYNATHEFGHALITSKFYEGVERMQAIRDESRQGLVTSLQALPEAQRAVAEEFNKVKQGVLEGTMPASVFMEQWMGPAKLGRANFLKDLGVSPHAPARDLVKAIVRRGASNSNIQAEVKKGTLQRQLEQDFLSLDEYLAEQVSRHAYKQKWDEQSPLGKFFGNALRGLRNFFIDRKRDGVIAPGVAFQEWLDGLNHTGRLDEVDTLVANKKRAGKKTPKAKGPTQVAPGSTTARIKVKKVAHNVNSDTSKRDQTNALKKVTFLEKAGVVSKAESKELRDLVRRQEWDQFVEVFQKIAVKNVSFEYDPDGSATKDPEWHSQKFDSPDFKAWFGDWRNNPEHASVVRTGVFVQNWDGTLTHEREMVAPPLVLFSSRARLEAGENVFFAGSLRGVHHHEANHPRQLNSAQMVPVVLNIRNPYIVGDLSVAAPNHADLRAQGFDGIIYQNDFMDDVSFVVFTPDQVKAVPDRSPYPRDLNMHLELDHDSATPEGQAAGKIYNGLKNFVSDQGPIRRMLRRVTQLSRFVLQMQQLAHLNPDLSDLQYMVNENTAYSRYGASRRALADDLVTEWERMGKEWHGKVNKFLIDQYESRERWFEVYRDSKMRPGDKEPSRWYRLRTTDTTLQKAREHGIDPDSDKGAEVLEFVRKVDESLLDYLNEDERVLFEILAHRLGHSPAVFKGAVTELAAKVHELRQQPFLPQGRFGNWVLVVSKRREGGPGHEVVYREAFESEAKWQEAWKHAVAKATPDMKIDKHIVTDSEYVLMSLPKDFVNLMASELGLSDETGPDGELSQIERLVQLLQPVKTEKLLSQYEKDRMVKGYSKDLMRSYAEFTWHHSNAQAKLLYRRKFNLAITNMREKLRSSRESMENRSPDEVGRLTRILAAMEKMRDYVMAPPNELQAARAAVSIGYLAFNVKTAMVNMWGLITTASDLTTKFGVANGSKRFAESMYYSGMSMKLTNLDERRAGEYMPPNLQKALDRALEEGVLSQSYAYHLANAAGQRNLVRMPAGSMSGRITKATIDLGMWPFRLTELASRRISFIAAMQEHLGKPDAGFDESYEIAVAQTNKLQNDYSLGNRVPFMRGGAAGLGATLPMITIFASFAQHMAFHGWGGYELGLHRERALKVQRGELPQEHMPQWYQWGYGYTARVWLLTMLLAGYEGLPGAENMLDLVEAVFRKFGWKPARQQLREMVQTVTDNPVLFSRGLGSNIMGFDISRSVGFGRLFPGTDTFSRASPQKPEEAVGAMTFDLAGPLGGFMKFGLEWYNKASTRGLMQGSKEAMRLAPGGIGNMINGYIWSQDGVKGPAGAEVTLEPDETGRLRPRDLTGGEIAGKFLGMNPEVVARNREIMWNQYDMKTYWQSKRQRFISDYVRSKDEGDREGAKDAREAVRAFNLEVAGEKWSKDFKISGKDLADGYKRFKRAKRRAEAGLPREKRYEGLYEDIRRSYGNEPSD